MKRYVISLSIFPYNGVRNSCFFKTKASLPRLGEAPFYFWQSAGRGTRTLVSNALYVNHFRLRRIYDAIWEK